MNDCVAHAGRPAERRCSRCMRLFCDACVRRVTVGEKQLESCPRCHAPVRPLEIADASAPLADEAWSRMLVRPLHVEPLLTALALAAPAWIGHFLGGRFATLMALISSAAVISYYFQTIDHIGRGRDGMPEPTGGGDSWGEIRSITWRGAVCALVGAAPFLVWYFGFARPSGEVSPAIALALLVAGQLYMPAAIIGVVMTDSNVAAIWPPAWVQIIARAPRAYVQLVGLYLAALVAALIFRFVLGSALEAIPIVGSLFAGALANVLVFMQAAIVGGFLRRNSLEFGY